MAYKDILFAIETYPSITPEAVWVNAAALARLLGGEVTALAFHLRIPAPGNRLANMLLRLDHLAKEEEAKSAVAAHEALRRFTEVASSVGLAVNTLVEHQSLYEHAERATQLARTRDLFLAAVGPSMLGDISTAESVLFGSGRPVIVFPEQGPPIGPTLSRVAIAWDGTRPAARSVSDALPLLKSASEVRVVTIIDEKPTAGPGIAVDLVRHLARHGISATVDEVKFEGDSIGKALRSYVAGQRIDLLVMGAFGHSRTREFILGGATRSMLDNPPIPLLMAH